ncbi:unnamed protein product [Colias eurytheme]|nr:unnamed protein product [Colias eurytheme]
MIDMIPKEFEVDFNHFDSDAIIVELQDNNKGTCEAPIVETGDSVPGCSKINNQTPQQSINNIKRTVKRKFPSVVNESTKQRNQALIQCATFFLNISKEKFSENIVKKPSEINPQLWGCKKYTIVKSLYGVAYEFKSGTNPTLSLPEGMKDEIVSFTDPGDIHISTWTEITNLGMKFANNEGIQAKTNALENHSKLLKQLSNLCHRSKRTLFVIWREGNDSTRYGKSNEITAIKEFANQLNMTIAPCGSFVDEDYCFLRASPDGLIGDDGIVE